MIKEINECLGCATESYPCRGASCPQRHIKVLICDECGNECEEVRNVDGEHLCMDCLLVRFPEVSIYD